MCYYISMLKKRLPFVLLLTLNLTIGLGLIYHIKKQTKQVVNMSNSLIPRIAGQSFYVGCMVSEELTSEDCMFLMEKFKADTAEINKLEE